MERGKAAEESREAINLRLFGRVLTPCPKCGWEHRAKVQCYRLARDCGPVMPHEKEKPAGAAG